MKPRLIPQIVQHPKVFPKEPIMKKLILLTVLASLSLLAGPLKLASQPVRHPLKDQAAVMNVALKIEKGVFVGTRATVKGLYKAVKAIVW